VDAKQLVALALQVSLLLTVLGFGLKATLADLTYMLREPGQLGRSLVAMFVVMPLVVVGLVMVLDLPPALEIVLVALSISPIPPLSPKKMLGAGGSREGAYGLLAAVSLLSIAIVPLAAHVLGSVFARPFVMPAAVAKIVIVSVLAPFAAGVIVHTLWPAAAARLERPVSLVGGVLLAAAAIVLVGAAWPAMWTLVGDGTLLAIAGFVAIGLLVGHVLGGPGLEQRIVLAISTATRHPMIAFTLASASYPEQRFGGTILLVLLVSAVAAVPYVRFAKLRVAARDVVRPQGR
jgi:BASS family bile acid:Na+ symporter